MSDLVTFHIVVKGTAGGDASERERLATDLEDFLRQSAADVRSLERQTLGQQEHAHAGDQLLADVEVPEGVGGAPRAAVVGQPRSIGNVSSFAHSLIEAS